MKRKISGYFRQLTILRIRCSS